MTRGLAKKIAPASMASRMENPHFGTVDNSRFPTQAENGLENTTKQPFYGGRSRNALYVAREVAGKSARSRLACLILDGSSHSPPCPDALLFIVQVSLCRVFFNVVTNF